MFRRDALNNTLVRLVGWVATILHGDPTMFDRWLWLRRRLLRGDLRTLDAGCGSGAFSLYAGKLGNEVLGLSFDERNNSVAQERARILGLANVSFVTCDLREIGQLTDELGQFDQILCFETIEHLLEDQKLVNEFARLLRPGGRLFLTTPSDRHRAFSQETVSDTEDGGHVRYGYSHNDLRRLFDNAALETVSLGYLTGPISQAILGVQYRLGSFSDPLAWIVTLPLRLLQIFDPLVSRASQVPHYCITATAIRPEQSA